MRRVVLLGAGGYTGRLTLAAMLRRGLRPVAAGRSEEALRRLVGELGVDLEVAVADATDAGSLRRLMAHGEVLVSTVGPFARWGGPVVEAAMDAGALYLDSNGEPGFTREVFERYGPVAEASGATLLTAFGWENVAGNLAAALSLREAGPRAIRVDTGYFYAGRTGFSSGTRASFAEAVLQPSYAWRDGELRAVRGGERLRSFDVEGSPRPALSLGASEHIAIPRSFDGVREVNAYLGWFGSLGPGAARALHRVSAVGSPLLRVPRVRESILGAVRRLPARGGDGPTADDRARAGVRVVGAAYDEDGTRLAETRLAGPEGYELTAELLAWGAEMAARDPDPRPGALGPVEAWGLDELERGCAALGLVAQYRYGDSNPGFRTENPAS
jgi:short subunit dehydrogenase-like uncharacterized protein